MLDVQPNGVEAPLNEAPESATTGGPNAASQEARRQLQICNACRYCEGYCSAFPAITRLRAFSDADITQIANLCHNCRGCYHACQYTAPHEFALNLPAALAEVRTDSWQQFVWPAGLGRLFQKQAWMTVGVAVLGFALLFLLIKTMPAGEGTGFYALLSHGAMVAIFAPAFLLPLVALGFGLRAYWRHVGGERIRFGHLRDAFGQAATMRNLAGGHGEGCNFEGGDQFSQARRWAHQAILYGFLLCFASTSSGTVLHYLFDSPAPYPPLSVPKILGVSGGLLLTAGCGWMLWLKSRADAALSDAATTAAGSAFTALLGLVGATGLALYWLGGTPFLTFLLAIHLGTVLTLFLLTPYSKMAHGFFRLMALVRDAQLR